MFPSCEIETLCGLLSCTSYRLASGLSIHRANQISLHLDFTWCASLASLLRSITLCSSSGIGHGWRGCKLPCHPPLGEDRGVAHSFGAHWWIWEAVSPIRVVANIWCAGPKRSANYSCCWIRLQRCTVRLAADIHVTLQTNMDFVMLMGFICGREKQSEACHTW